MTNIKLLFTCPHGGKDDGQTEDPPIPERVSTQFPDNICPDKEGQGFIDENDALTQELTVAIAKNIANLREKTHSQFMRNITEN